ncbi:MAG: hypothetical protein NC230_10055 [Bacteroides sp.]|nr:hypothetical protein [Bacteroides sp.]
MNICLSLTRICALLLCILAISCSDHRATSSRLSEAERLMGTDAAEALSILDSIQPADITSGRLRADYALLLTQARDKNFHFETNDSLIATAVDYFDAHPVGDRQTLAHFYRGVVNLYKGNLTLAITEALTTLDLARELDDPYILAKTNELIADIYAATFNFDHAIPYRRQAADFYRQAGKTLNEQYALVELSSAYHRVGKHNESIALLDSISPEIADSTLLGFLHATYMKPMVALSQYESARYHSIRAEQFWDDDASELQNRPYTSYIYSLLGQLDSAEYYLKLEEKYNPDWKEFEEYHWAKSNILIQKDDYKMAVDALRDMQVNHDKGLKELLKSNVALAESDFHYQKSISEHDKAERYHIITWMLIAFTVMICMAFYIFHSERMKRKRLEIENRMLEAQELASRINVIEHSANELKSIIEHKDDRLNRQMMLVNRLFKDRYKVLNNLSNEYFEKRNSKATRTLIIKDFEREIEKLKQDDYIDQLKAIVDQCRENILTRMREQLPRFKESDITFCALVLAGFSPRAICLLMEITHGNYYNKWTRIRARISESDAPDREFFLELLNNKL